MSHIYTVSHHGTPVSHSHNMVHIYNVTQCHTVSNNVTQSHFYSMSHIPPMLCNIDTNLAQTCDHLKSYKNALKYLVLGDHLIQFMSQSGLVAARCSSGGAQAASNDAITSK